MKKYLMAFMLLCATVGAEMIWVDIDPTIKSSSKSSEAALESGIFDKLVGGSEGSLLSVVVNDSSANADSITVTWYSYPINTEDVIAATGLVEVRICTDTSDMFDALGDSVMAYYTLKTGYIPYDTSTDFTLISRAKITGTSGAVGQIAITLGGDGGEFMDTLFKAWTWFEIELFDSTLWIEAEYTQDWIISGSGLDDATVAGTYNLTTDDAYKYWFPCIGEEPDSIAWCHFNLATGANTGTIDTTAVTGSAQNLDSGMTINFNATDGHDLNDSFIFIYDDSLHYGKQVDFKVRMGLNVKRRK